jgi:hypothetical protein
MKIRFSRDFIQLKNQFNYKIYRLHIEQHTMAGIFGVLFSYSVGIVSGVYIAQNYQVPNVQKTVQQQWAKFKAWEAQRRKD